MSKIYQSFLLLYVQAFGLYIKAKPELFVWHKLCIQLLVMIFTVSVEMMLGNTSNV